MNKLSTLGTLAPYLILAVAALAGCGGGGDTAPADRAPAADAAPAVDPSQTGSVEGVITLANGPDPDTEIRMDADPVCAGLHSEPVHSQTRITGEGGELANVLVYVKTPGVSGRAPAEPLVLNQEGCIYKPHVAAMTVGQTLKVVNSDPTLHNVHAIPKVNAEFNQAQPFQGMELERKFDKTELAIPIKCDVHPWMQSYISVLPHPYFAVTGEDGSFTIQGVPAGTHEIEAWHETLGTQTGQVTVDAGGSADLSLTFGAG
ncbi:MAG TPA: carboxypeptidase regulatory-like domain-containing protein [Thermoanaerobaculia bacterium]|nr:carboxypeptidase regulatory-like domain-containing protein [Thermoanaerobaculia bacterium]